MRITTWNVNGLRKLTPLSNTFQTLQSDIICIQETRVSSLDNSDAESLVFVPGFYSFYSVCRTRGGYSGVATFCAKPISTPIVASNAIDDDAGGVIIPSQGPCTFGSGCDCLGAGYDKSTLDAVRDEGRFILTDHVHFVLINVYVPATSIPLRAAFKLSFLHALNAKISALTAAGRRVILVGDFNICPTRIDSAERRLLPANLEWDRRPARRWLFNLLSPPNGPLIDSFRLSYPARTDAYTCWSESTQARKTNYGVRIDLILVDRDIVKSDSPQTEIWQHIIGSDHCPVSLKLYNDCYNSPVATHPPPFCAHLLSSFTKRQQSIRRYFSKSNATHASTKPSDIGPKTLKKEGLRSTVNNVECAETQPLTKRSALPNFLGLSAPGKSIVKPKIKRAGSGTTRADRRVQHKKMHANKKGLSYFHGFEQWRSTNANPSGDETCTKTASFSSEDAKSSQNEPPNSDGCDQKITSAPLLQTQMRQDSTKSGSNSKLQWRKLLCGPKKAPMCHHGQRCVLKTVAKSGENKGRTFYSCSYPHGIGPHTNCNFFQWAPFDARFPLVTLPP